MRGDVYYEDGDWYPNLSLELINRAKLVVNFSSTTIKECVLLKTPVINFDIKKHRLDLLLDFLYDYDYCKSMNPSDFNFETFKNNVDFLTETDLNYSYDESISKHLFDVGKTSEKIIDFYKGSL